MYANNITVINEDIMKCDLEALTREHFGGMKKLVCANLPYYITTPIVAHLLESKCFDAVTVMMQKEVAARLSSAPGCSDYGAFTVFVNYYAEVEILFEVPRGCFVPEPKVDSAVVRLNVRKNPIIVPRDEALFFRVVRASFAQRRKLLANGLAAVFGAQIPKERINEILNGLEMPSNVRGETLSIAQFCAIADAFY
ncbi:MAG: 16S rRNA (adenine(1518)-N(6)/adenine(1519)-N(6))-dimethyltransferase RsmA, partial [Oscillospiraceae bacterium]